MFVNYYKNIKKDLKEYIYINEKDFNNSPKNVREFIIINAQIKKKEKEKKLLFKDIPNEVKNHIEIDKESFEDLDILSQQLIIKYVFKYKELLNAYENKGCKNSLDKVNTENNCLKIFLTSLHIILNNDNYTYIISEMVNKLGIYIGNSNKCIKRLKVNIKNNKNKIMNNTIKKDISYYENKIAKYENELHEIHKIYVNYKLLYKFLNNIIDLKKIN